VAGKVETGEEKAARFHEEQGGVFVTLPDGTLSVRQVVVRRGRVDRVTVRHYNRSKGHAGRGGQGSA
jgi:hypothetical protein